MPENTTATTATTTAPAVFNPNGITGLLAKLRVLARTPAPLPDWENMTDEQRRLQTIGWLVEMCDVGIALKEQYPSTLATSTGLELAIASADLMLANIEKAREGNRVNGDL